MAKPQYRLQALLEIRERAKEEKEEELARAKKKLQHEQQVLEELRKKLEDMREMRRQKHEELMQQTQEGTLGINGYLQAERYLKRVDKEIQEFEENDLKEQYKRVVFAEQEVEWAHEEMLKALQEYKALEKHKEKWEEEWKREKAQREELNQEEIATTIWTFKDR